MDMLQAARQLAEPGSKGADPADAFDGVVPSLPGFLYSELPRRPPSSPGERRHRGAGSHGS